MAKLYKKHEIIRKFKDKYINICPNHHSFWNDKTNKYETVYSVRGVSKTIKENFNLPEVALETC